MATRSDVSASKQKLRGLRRRQSKSAPPTTNSSSDFPNSPHKKKAAYKQFPLHINATLSKGDARWGWHKDDVFFIRKGAREDFAKLSGHGNWGNVQRQLNLYHFKFVAWVDRKNEKVSLHKGPEGFCTRPEDIKRKDSPSSSSCTRPAEDIKRKDSPSSSTQKTKSRRSPSPGKSDFSDSKTSHYGTNGLSAIEICSPEFDSLAPPETPAPPEELSNNQLTRTTITSKAPFDGISLFGANMKGSASTNNLDVLYEDYEDLACEDPEFSLETNDSRIEDHNTVLQSFTSSRTAQASPVAPSPHSPRHRSNNVMSFSNSGSSYSSSSSSSGSIGGVNEFKCPSQLRQSSDTAFEARQITTLSFKNKLDGESDEVLSPSGTEPFPPPSQEEIQCLCGLADILLDKNA